SVAVVAGHSNTVPALAKELGCELPGLVLEPGYGEVLAHDSHDRIAQVILPADGAPKLVELRY
ncbi:MAG TPA: hypothetical protein VJ744_05600, partial [Gaiellaceae bacterium]|nr:hypothetical protein [Gaiellaceae bacterium]